MTTEEVRKLKSLAERDIIKILVELRAKTECRITGISVTSEEGFGFQPEIITDVHIKLEI